MMHGALYYNTRTEVMDNNNTIHETQFFHKQNKNELLKIYYKSKISNEHGK